MDTLSKLFGNTAKVKIMRLFISNISTPYDVRQVSVKAKVSPKSTRSVITLLSSVDYIKPKVFTKEETKTLRHKKVQVKKKANGWIMNPNFPYFDSMYNLLIQGRPTDGSDIMRRLKPAGILKLVITSGVFIRNPDSRIDILIVGDKIKKGVLDNAIRNLEAEIGKEIEYAVFETEEFAYRMNVYDKLIRDVLEFPHEKIYNKLGI
ncbi:hypothetical protein COW81_01730 [Candidatus Campbellbacteria bacterium CG22_combo_CG10-13_8_21_14_all_36_13]|uniref:Transcriptional regulator n=1 Tax=Candidatus Campbellbacteria bacterium CG22_combo_CG10-13_8_21_14_all_36_13 TaxID=1974529 RepID=A0A2H0DZX2_9BACT|nr:MAG: hypothetical protein COW81_01730 [Candidatus Campbellbacteria bacterium CG22_combo_CG10-13_8_21_14_all_36_13]